MPRYKLIIEYDGTGYRGWQSQTNARSIQGTMIETAGHVLGCKVDIQASGRTDAGVHALGQAAHMETPKRISPRTAMEKLNDELPSSINILSIEEARPEFHARHHALGRSYLYFLSRRRTAFAKRYVWWVRDHLDMRHMKAAIALFRGFHDFSSFTDKRRDKNASPLVKIDSAGLEQFGDTIVFRFIGSHFLWKMVRRMVGVTVEAGRGNLAVKDIEAMLRAYSEEPAPLTAPPSGLFLEQVLYAGDSWRPFTAPSWPLIRNGRP
jgi:tRNA pseudouridine38-40 synthase